jgi:hypothetical protein
MEHTLIEVYDGYNIYLCEKGYWVDGVTDGTNAYLTVQECRNEIEEFEREQQEHDETRRIAVGG